MRPRWLTLALAVLLYGGSSFAQRSDPLFAELPFAQWAGENSLQLEIPWKVHVFSAGLTVFQRIIGAIHVDIDGRYLVQGSGEGTIVALLQITDSDGHVYQDHSKLPPIDHDNNAAARLGAFFDWRMFVLPGHYSVEIALFDQSTGKHAFTRRPLIVQSLSKDPLPGAWRDSPSIEFLKQGQAPDKFFHPEATSTLRLALPTRRAVRLEVLANLTGSGGATVSHNAYNFNLMSLLPILKTFSQIEISNGTLNVAALDLIRRHVAFEQADVHGLDWPALKTAIASADPTKVDVKALEDVRHTAAFLRSEVARRIQPGGSETGNPLQVLIFVSSSDVFESLADLSEIPLPAECDCLVFYLRYSPIGLRYHASPAEFDNVRRVLKPLKIRAHLAESPEDLRRILAQILDEISKMDMAGSSPAPSATN